MPFPTAFHNDIVTQARWIATLGATDGDFAKIYGVSVRTWHRWKREHPDLKRALKQGKAIADYVVEHRIYDRAIRGDMQAARWWMRFRGKQILPDVRK